jgi:hypothetical protein
MIRRSIVILATVLLLACKKEEPPPAPAAEPTPVATVPAAAPAAPAEPVVDLDKVPVEEDFEEEAEKEVTPATLLKTVDELEKEISAN